MMTPGTTDREIYISVTIKICAFVGTGLDRALDGDDRKISVTTGTIVQEMQAGYMIKDRLLRPAMVGVAKKPD